jgi:hypothetical protein
LSPTLTAPRTIRRDWIREVGMLIEESRTGDPITLAAQAGRYGHNTVPTFREARRRLNELMPPPECQGLHDAIGNWIDQHVLACEVLIRASEMRTLRPLREAQERLAEGRAWAGRFNQEYLQVVEDLRQRVAIALGRAPRRRRRGGFANRLARSFFGAGASTRR